MGAEILGDIKTLECAEEVAPSVADAADGALKKKRPRRDIDEDDLPDDAGGLSSTSLLETHEVCRRFHNRIAIVGASPGSICLGGARALKTSRLDGDAGR